MYFSVSRTIFLFSFSGKRKQGSYTNYGKGASWYDCTFANGLVLHIGEGTIVIKWAEIDVTLRPTLAMVSKMVRKKKQKVLALDTSTKKTGWALFINGKYAESGVLDYSKEKIIEKRIKKMCLAIATLIFDKSPDDVVIEQLSSTRNADTTRKLSRIIGAVYYYCISKDINYSEMSCRVWRNTVGIKNSNGEKVKIDSMNRVLQKYKLDVDDNEADAINICDAFCLKKQERKEKI